MRVENPGLADPAAGPLAQATATGAQRTSDAPAFAELLQRQLAVPPGDAVQRGASTVEGTAQAPSGAAAPSALTGGDLEALLPYGPARRVAPDAFGWRSLTRGIGDSVIGPGFGALFERQIAQESGYLPEVVFGLRRSTAGAEGIAQLMPEYYPNVDRTDPEASLLAGARSMRHYLGLFDGDVRRALASYNAGAGRVRSLVEAHGDEWESALPQETQRYLAAILGGEAPYVPYPANMDAASTFDLAVFGGAGAGGVLTLPIDRLFDERFVDGLLLDILAGAGVTVRAPAAGRVEPPQPGGEAQSGEAVVLDHGNGWRSALLGLSELAVSPGQDVNRAAVLGALAETAPGQGLLRFGVSLFGRALDPRRYLLRA